MVANTFEADTTRQLGKLENLGFMTYSLVWVLGNTLWVQIPNVQITPNNVTAVTGIVKVTTMYRSIVLVRVG